MNMSNNFFESYKIENTKEGETENQESRFESHGLNFVVYI